MHNSDLVRHLEVAAIWFLLAPLMMMLAAADTLSKGRSRNWPFSYE